MIAQKASSNTENELCLGHALALIEDEMRRYLRTGGKMGEVARKTGLNPMTVRRLAYGETRLPRLGTVLALLTFFGYEVTVQRKSPQPRLRAVV